MRVDARDPRYRDRFTIIDARTGKRGTKDAIYADDEKHVIDLERDTILFNVRDGLGVTNAAAREEVAA